MTLEEIQQATTRDKTLQCVVHLMRNQGWKDLNSLPDERQEADLSELRQFNRVQHELTVEYYSTQKSDSDPIRITGKSCIACTSGTPRNCQNQTSTPREGLVPQHWQVCQRKHWQMHCLSSKQSWEQTGSFANVSATTNSMANPRYGFLWSLPHWRTPVCGHICLLKVSRSGHCSLNLAVQ